jgi:FkbM family methyltransferase
MTEQEYNGLYGEVVTEDVYGLKSLDFVPDVVIDVGACVGIFSEYAGLMFPKANIISIEPNWENCQAISSKNIRTFLINAAIGKGKMYHILGAVNGAHECYYPCGLTLPDDAFETSRWEEFTGRAIMITDEIVTSGIGAKDKLLIKIDIENAEDVIFQDKDSMLFLRGADYVAIELHDCPRQVNELLALLDDTHDCVFEHQIFKARKR